MDPSQPRLSSQVAEVAVVAALWVLLFEFNGWLFSFAEFNSYINWVFLPAALRVAAVLVAGWRGAAGLFLGAVFTNDPVIGVNALDTLALSTLSAASPLLAVGLARWRLGVRADLAGLRFQQLIAMAALGALASSIAHNLYFHQRYDGYDLVDGLITMFAGDMVGTLLVLYLTSVVLRYLGRRPR